MIRPRAAGRAAYPVFPAAKTQSTRSGEGRGSEPILNALR